MCALGSPEICHARGFCWSREDERETASSKVRREKMDTKPKDDKPTDFDLEMAVFGAP
jgi:hypothetical protein